MIIGVLLAAGGATRFGSQKLLAPFRGTPLVRHGANALAQSTDGVVVVVGSEANAVRAALAGSPVQFVENPGWARGLSSSLHCGIAALPADAEAVVVALGDQPLMDPRIVTAVIERWRTAGRAIVAARYNGVQGHPVLFHRSVFPELLAVHGDSGARSVIARSAERTDYVDSVEPAPPDVDTPEDLAALHG